MAREMNGAESAGAEPAAARVRLAFLKKRRLVTGGSLFVLILAFSSWAISSWASDPRRKICLFLD
jgi:hypothetical protein